MNCPECGRKTRAQNTFQKNGDVIRVRVCPCGYRCQTIETVYAEAEKTPKQTKNRYKTLPKTN